MKFSSLVLVGLGKLLLLSCHGAAASGVTQLRGGDEHKDAGVTVHGTLPVRFRANNLVRPLQLDNQNASVRHLTGGDPPPPFKNDLSEAAWDFAVAYGPYAWVKHDIGPVVNEANSILREFEDRRDDVEIGIFWCELMASCPCELTNW